MDTPGKWRGCPEVKKPGAAPWRTAPGLGNRAREDATGGLALAGQAAGIGG